MTLSLSNTHHYKIFGIHFYISQRRMKPRHKNPFCDKIHSDRIKDNKEKLYERQDCRCAHCGQYHNLSDLEYHHILPLARFPEYANSIRNGVLLCHNCHKEVHINPFWNGVLIVKKCIELGIDVREKYQLYRQLECQSAPIH